MFKNIKNADIREPIKKSFIVSLIVSFVVLLAVVISSTLLTMRIDSLSKELSNVSPVSEATQQTEISDELETETKLLSLHSIDRVEYSNICEYLEYGEYLNLDYSRERVSQMSWGSVSFGIVLIDEEFELGSRTYVMTLAAPQFRSFASNIGMEPKMTIFYDTYWAYPSRQDEHKYLFEVEISGLDVIAVNKVLTDDGSLVWDPSMTKSPRELTELEKIYFRYFGAEELDDTFCPDGIYIWSYQESNIRGYAVYEYLEENNYWVFSVAGGLGGEPTYDYEFRWVDESTNVLVAQKKAENFQTLFLVFEVPENKKATLQKKELNSDGGDWEDVFTTELEGLFFIQVDASGLIKKTDNNVKYMTHPNNYTDSISYISFDFSQEEIIEYWEKYYSHWNR